MIHNEEEGAIGGREDRRKDPEQDITEARHTEEFKESHKDDSIRQVTCKQQNLKDNIHQDAIYCCHCGNYPVSDLDNYCLKYESLKTTVETVITKYSKIKKYKNLLSVGIHVDYLYDCHTTHKDKHSKRKRKRQELLNKVVALLNTESGHILIHLVGRNIEKHYKGAFDEFVDENLKTLINDGRLFTDVYKKGELSEVEGFSDYPEFLMLTVERSDYLYTSEFKTKCVTDDNIDDIKEDTLIQFLGNRKSFDTTHHQIDISKLGEIPTLCESREVQMKAIYQNGKGDEWLVTNIIENLRLPHYISGFSKNSQGGTFVAGVIDPKQRSKIKTLTENKSPAACTKEVKENDFYKTATVVEPKNLPSLLQRDLKRTCLVCDYEGNIEDVDDLVITTLLPHMKKGQHLCNKYIILVAARPVCGLVFNDPEGPVAYVVSENKSNSLVDSIGRLPFNKWFVAIKQIKCIGLPKKRKDL